MAEATVSPRASARGRALALGGLIACCSLSACRRGDVPNEALASPWRKLAARYKDETANFAYGLMNEPHDTNGLWPAAAQAAVDTIRSADRNGSRIFLGPFRLTTHE